MVELDPELEAEFDQLVARTDKANVRAVLIANKEKLVSNFVSNKEALEAISKSGLMGYQINEGHADILKGAFASPGAPSNAVASDSVLAALASIQQQQLETKAAEEENHRELMNIKQLVQQSSQATRHASTINERDYDAVISALKIVFVQKGLENISDTASQVLQDLTEFSWEENKHEARHKPEYIKFFQDRVKLPGHLMWSPDVDKSAVLRTSANAGGASLPFDIGARTDALIAIRNSCVTLEASIAATLVLKKKVVAQSLRQTRVTYVCASLKSQIPVISGVTDMGEENAAYYTDGQKTVDGNTIVYEHLFPSADDLATWLGEALSAQSVPPNLLRFRGNDFVTVADLPNPKRIRLPVPTREVATNEHILSLLSGMMMPCDVACHADLEPFGANEFVPYIC